MAHVFQNSEFHSNSSKCLTEGVDDERRKMIYRPKQFNEQQRLRSAIILDAIEQLDGLIQANSPKGAQQTLALRHLEDVAMRVNKAISEEQA